MLIQTRIPLRRCTTLLACCTLFSASALFAQDHSQNSDIESLKEQIRQMQLQNQKMQQQNQSIQRQYQQQTDQLEAQVKALQSKADSGSILNTHVLTDSDGKGVADKATAPVLDESFLKSLTRNFTFSAYIRSSFGINGNGGDFNFSFIPPDTFNSSRARLGNENDTYFELTWAQAHLLGDDPNQMDVSMVFTPAIQFGDNRNNYQSINSSRSGIFWEQAYVEAKNVFKSAPDVTLWMGQRFYERYNIDPMDYWYVNPSGYGAGIGNIDVGIGKLSIAWLAGTTDQPDASNDYYSNFHNGAFEQNLLDVRIKDIDLFGGKLMLFAQGMYAKGGTFDISSAYPNDTADKGTLTMQDNYGVGGGFIWQYDFGNKSMLQISGLYSYGALNMPNPWGSLSWAAAIANNQKTFTNGSLNQNIGNALNRQQMAQATVQYIWNPTDNFSLGAWFAYQYSDEGYSVYGNNGGSTPNRRVSPVRNLYNVGVRPIFWLTDTFAIQGQAVGYYMDNDREYPGLAAFGRSGSMGVFTIAPTFKPKGGYFTRPEFRVFATYAIWSNSLKGVTTPWGEGPNNEGQIGGPSNLSSVYSNSNQGWLFGTSVEWFF
jgi:maltoporin